MNILVDSHAFLWALILPEKLSREAREALESPGGTIFVSSVSFWEIALKHSLGKLDLTGISPAELPRAAESAGFSLLPLQSQTAASSGSLPRMSHKDPFDRMLAWQAIDEHLSLVSRDSAMREYVDHGLKLIW